MSKEPRCVAKCQSDPVIFKPVPLCTLHGLEVASEVLSGVLEGSVGRARREAAARRRTDLAAVAAPPGAVKSRGRPDRPTQAEADRLAAERLAALKEAGLERITPGHFRDLPKIVGRSRPWVYMWLGSQVDGGVLVPDYRGEQAGYRFAA